ncbi:pre-mRNA 3'-end-processing factor FIP1 isoform X2 [Silurus asotus]|uniref:Pre-mRNA 3'-end-processing factor FIP1 isoform X2 n=1 Tax=Silurus asotus TaxID=30991 RepID=A0AAD5FPK2_SILAS|nr:pre-mRNA 3'-end-processing factor FIP1 isoform X2 [Silurus asotus]
MSAVEPEKATGTESVEDEDWLYGEDVDNGRDVAEAVGDEDDEKKTETEIFSALVGDVEGIITVDHQDGDADSNSDSDDNLRVTIGDIKTDRMQSIVCVSAGECRTPKSSIDVIGGQTETIVCVEGQRPNSTDGNSMQCKTLDKKVSFKCFKWKSKAVILKRTNPAVKHVGGSIGNAGALNAGFPLPPEVPPPPFTSGSGHPGGSYDSRCAPYFPFAAGVYPHTLGPMNPWLGVSDHAKAWNYHSSQDNPRERVKDRERTRERERAREPKKEQERERDQENTPAFPSRSSDKERASRHRDHSGQESDRQREHEREREREDRRRERRHRERNERHKSSRSSSSWRKHSIDDGESHRRHRLKRSKCNKDSTDTGSTE